MTRAQEALVFTHGGRSWAALPRAVCKVLPGRDPLLESKQERQGGQTAARDGGAEAGQAEGQRY